MNRLEQMNRPRGTQQISALIVWVAILPLAFQVSVAVADNAQVARGKYLVDLAGCSHCHTPGYMLGKPDMSRLLAGSDVGFAVPGVGTFVGRNLTPDKDTGIGNWSTDQIVAALRAGVRPDGRVLSPIMPWQNYSNMTHSDAIAIAVYLKSLSPIKHSTPGPFAANEPPDGLRATVRLPPPEDATSDRERR
jgi:mono/diheme cytochrome c family protein